MSGMAATRIYLELGDKKAFACSLDWPGWCRVGRTPEAAIESLAEYAPRYAVIAKEAGQQFTAEHDFEVVERLKGNATTDFGAPACVAAADHEPLSKAEAARLASLLEASWAVLDRVAATAPAELRKGPRGGGRSRDKIVQHVVSAEASYARKLGVKFKEPAFDDREAVAAGRAAIADAVRASHGAEAGSTSWPARYLARRAAWHVVDHVWEIEDRST